MENKQEKLVDIKTVAEFLDYSVNTVNNMVAKGIIKAYRPKGGRRRFLLSEVLEAIKEEPKSA